MKAPTRRGMTAGVLGLALPHRARAEAEPPTIVIGEVLRDGGLVLDGVRHTPFTTGAPYAIRVVRPMGSEPPRLFRFEVRPGDDGGHAGAVDKVELQTGPVAPPGAEAWRSWALRLPAGPPPPVAPHGENWLILGQWHATEDTAATRGFDDDSVSPPLAHDFTGGAHAVLTRADPQPRQLRSRYPLAQVQVRDPRFPRGRWVRFVERTRFGWTGDAVLQVWRDGRLIVDRRSSFSMGYNDVRSPHCCWGIYRNRYDPAPLIAWYANVEFGGTELAARISAPRSIPWPT